MATSEENEIEIDTTSDDVEKTFICQPCGDDGERHAAVGFCINCREYLCQRCYECHLVPSITKRHALLDKDHMTELEVNYSCQQHRDKDIEYHCPTHSFLGCHLCFYQHQKTCKDAKYIQEVSSSAVWSEEVVKINKSLENITSKCIKLQKDIKHNLLTVTSKHTEALAAIRDFKQDILNKIDKLEKELVDKMDKVKKEETDKLKNLSKRVEILLNDSQKMSATVETLQNKEQTNKLYIELVQFKDKLLRQEDQVQTTTCENQVKQFVFQANKYLVEMLKSPWGLGSMRLTTNIERVTHVRDINCKAKDDTNECLIYGMVVLADQKLIITDRGTENTVKLIDTGKNKILSNLNPNSESWGICKITNTMVAVTLPDDEKIMFLRTDPTLSLEREIVVNGAPRGIDYLDGKLVVSYNSTPFKVEIMDMQGTVISTFDKDSNGQPLFDNPFHLAINPNNKLIYVSNYSGNNVVCMTFDGTVVATYKDNELKSPRQVTFDSSGMVYVLGGDSKNVHQITEDCKKVKVILTSSDGLSEPRSLLYKENEGHLIIGQAANNIKVYKLHYTIL